MMMRMLLERMCNIEETGPRSLVWKGNGKSFLQHSTVSIANCDILVFNSENKRDVHIERSSVHVCKGSMCTQCIFFHCTI